MRCFQQAFTYFTYRKQAQSCDEVGLQGILNDVWAFHLSCAVKPQDPFRHR